MARAAHRDGRESARAGRALARGVFSKNIISVWPAAGGRPPPAGALCTGNIYKKYCTGNIYVNHLHDDVVARDAAILNMIYYITIILLFYCINIHDDVVARDAAILNMIYYITILNIILLFYFINLHDDVVARDAAGGVGAQDGQAQLLRRPHLRRINYIILYYITIIYYY